MAPDIGPNLSSRPDRRSHRFFSFKLAWNEHIGHETANWILDTWIVAFIVLLLIMAFALLPHSALGQIQQWSVALCIALGAEAKTAWLIVDWVPFLILADMAYSLDSQALGLNAKLDSLALFLGLARLLLTGLLA